mmetsp:Transcript_147408/g.260642  ORF Transcript_147408/g.260642 Transcript_147408/m.260642 type:complete len:490 (+) Transcript_147408:96-1565(+)
MAQGVVGSFNYGSSQLYDLENPIPYRDTLTAYVESMGKDLPGLLPAARSQGPAAFQTAPAGRTQKEQSQTLADVRSLISLASHGLKWGEYPQMDMKAHTASSRILDALQDIKGQRTQDMQKLLRRGLLKRKPAPRAQMTSMAPDVYQECHRSRPQQSGTTCGASIYNPQVDTGFASPPGTFNQEFHSNGMMSGGYHSKGTAVSGRASGSPISPPASIGIPAETNSSGESYQALEEMRRVREGLQVVKKTDGHAGGTKKLVCQEIKRILRNRNAASRNISTPNSGDLWNVTGDNASGSQEDMASAGMPTEYSDVATKGDISNMEPPALGICSTSQYVIKNTFVEPADNTPNMGKISARDYFSEQPRLRSYTLSREDLPMCKALSTEVLHAGVKPLSADDLPRVIRALSQEDLPIIEPMDEDSLANGMSPSSLDAVMQQERAMGDLQDRGYVIKNTFIDSRDVNHLDVQPTAVSFRSEGAHILRSRSDGVY